jgi:hypothetical protein
MRKFFHLVMVHREIIFKHRRKHQVVPAGDTIAKRKTIKAINQGNSVSSRNKFIIGSINKQEQKFRHSALSHLSRHKFRGLFSYLLHRVSCGRRVFNLNFYTIIEIGGRRESSRSFPDLENAAKTFRCFRNAFYEKSKTKVEESRSISSR